MDVADIKSCVLKPDVCRCCLSRSGTQDLTVPYVTDAGTKEVCANILRNCFGVILSFLNEMGASNTICHWCMKQLLDASIFQKQVIEADKLFSQYWNTTKDTSSIPVINSCNQQNLGESNCKQKYTENDNDNDSDTPIARFRNNPVMEDFVETEQLETDKKVKKNILYQHKNKIVITDQSEMQNHTSTKQISVRKRIIITCRILLIETTACPFRHYRSWFRCFFCTDDFMDIKTLRSHCSQKHANVEAELRKIKRYPHTLQIEISNLECRHCNTSLLNVDAMVDHFIEKHKKILYKEFIADYKVNSSPYICHLCEKEFHVFRTLTTHLNEHYANCICDVCGKSFINSKRLKVHRRTHENGVYPCTVCSKILKTKNSQIHHMESTHFKRVIKCQICLKRLKHYNDRIKHMSLVHNITYKFKCPFCDREYNIKHYLANHIRKNHGHRNQRCKVCSMAFITKHSLQRHMLKHTGKRPYSCTVCSKSYSRNYSLQEHLRSHENDKQ